MYPVASMSSGELLYVHQIDSTKIELFIYDTVTEYYRQGISSLFSPASLQLLPGEKGFSFIDQGRLRIKYFDKRSPKTIDFYEPLYNLTIIHWVNDESCYFSAKQGDNIGIFQCNIDETIACLLKAQGKDYLYPQKIGKNLFCIERVLQDEAYYKMVKTSYNDNNDAIIELYNFNTIPVMFLSMVSEEKGFIISYQKNVHDSDIKICFTYHHLLKEQQNVWQVQDLFSFSIPLIFLQSQTENFLYESILPLLPRIMNDVIYFVDCAHNKQNILLPYKYVMSTKQIHMIKGNENLHNFTPYIFGNKFIIGGEKMKIIDITH